MNTKDFHRIPRKSASGAGRIFACGAAHAREWEAHKFSETHGINLDKESKAASDGSLVHEILAGVPYYSKSLGLGAPRGNLLQAVEESARSAGIGLEKHEFWYCVRAIKRRDAFITHTIQKAIDETGGVEKVDINLDSERLTLPGADYSGLPDIEVIVTDAAAEKRILVLDAKTGWGADDNLPEDNTNKQLLALVVMSAAKARESGAVVREAHTATLTRGSLYEPGALVTYSAEQIKKAEAMLRERIDISDKAKALLEAHDYGTNDPLADDIQKALAEISEVGDHCTFCSGKACCTKMREELDLFSEELDSSETQSLREYSPPKKPRKGEVPKEPKPMTHEELAIAIAKTQQLSKKYSPFNALHDHLKDQARQILQGDAAALDGVALRAPVKEASIRPTVTNAEGEEVAVDQSPVQMYEYFSPYIGDKVSRRDFVTACGNTNAKAVQELLATVFECDPREAFEELEKRLPEGVKSLVVMKERSPVVTVDVEKILQGKQEEEAEEAIISV